MKLLDWTSLQTRITFGMLLAMLLTLWSTIWLASHVLRKEMETSISAQQFSAVALAAKEVDRTLSERISAIEKLADRLARSHVPVDEQQRFLENLVTLPRMFNQGIMLLDAQGVARASVPATWNRIGTDYHDMPTIHAVLENGRTMVTDPMIGKVTGQPIVSVIAPIRDSAGHVLGLVIGITNLAKPNFLDTVNAAKYGASGDFFIIAPKSRMYVASSDKHRVMQVGPPVGVNPVYDRYMEGHEGSGLAISSRGVLELSSSKWIPSAGWVMASVLPADEAFAPVINMQRRLFGGALVLTMLVGGLAWWWLWHQFYPVSEASDLLARMGDGSLPRQPLPVRRNDEIGQLSNAFNGLLTRIVADEERAVEHAANERLRKIVSHVPGVVFQYRLFEDGHGCFPFVSKAFTEIYGVAPEEVQDSTSVIRNMTHPEDKDRFFASLYASAESLTLWRVDYRIRRPDGVTRWLFLEAMPEPDNMSVTWYGSIVDITEAKAAEEEIRYLAFYDQLTQLPNRRLLLDRLQQAINASSRNGRYGALLFLDLDNFKTLNDAHGHDVGDRLLVEVATRLQACVRENDTVARLGGDEFVLMIQDLDGAIAEQQAAAFAHKVSVALRQPYELSGREYRGTSSFGIALFDGEEVSVEELLKRADLAMYQAKSEGRNTLSFFNPEMQARIDHRSMMEGELHRALAEQEFVLHFQPQIDLADRCIGVEALIRWQSPIKGMVQPGDFIPVAEECGLIEPIGRWVVRQTCERLAAWSNEVLMADLTIAVNVSARQFLQDDFIAQVHEAITHFAIEPSRLKLEITESLLLDNIDDAIAKMLALRDLGVGFSLDDFGTGYSSLSYLKRLPLDQIKIDRSFVNDILTDPNDAAICQAIIALGKSLGLNVMAEGVETESQWKRLREEGCAAVQGYLFARPMSESDLIDWMRQHLKPCAHD